jgi:hypothetical protein
MKEAFLATLLWITLWGCTSMNIGSESSTQIDGYRTYAWIRREKDFQHSDPLIDNDTVEARVIRYVNHELTAKGYTIDATAPDLLIDYDIVTQTKQYQVQQPVYSPVYNVPYYYNNQGNTAFVAPSTYILSYKTVNVPYEDGTVTIYMLDRRTSKLIWRGWAEGSVDNVDSFERELPKDLAAIFRKFHGKPQ